MSTYSEYPDDARFGTDAFYLTIGRAFVTICAIVPLLFGIELADRLLPGDLEKLGGIWPGHLSGLDGVLLSPFLHADFAHLYGNSVVLIPLGTFVLAAGVGRSIGVTLVIMLAAGLGVWFLGNPNTIVIGASGVVFGYLGYLIARGLVEHSWWNIGVAVLIGLIYGWQLSGILPGDPRISWQGHLFGFGGGIVAAVLFRRRRVRLPAAPELPTDATLDLPAQRTDGRLPSYPVEP